MNEQNSTDKRLALLNELLQCPHSNLDDIYKVHKGMIDEDPLFYQRLSAWYFSDGNGQVRDHKEVFIINLVTHPDPSFRETGLALLEQLPPFQVEHVISYISGKYDKKTKKVVGLNRNVPRSLKTCVKNYLEARSEDRAWFDSTVLNARSSLKRLYSLLHLKPSPRTQAILFSNSPPEDSVLYDLKRLVKMTEPSEMAKLIIEKKIPYRVASTVVKEMSPTVLLALIEVMSPQELINNMGALQKRGVFDNAELKKVVEEKLESAKHSKKISALKSLEAVKAAGLSDDLNKTLQSVADTQVKSKGRITRPTALFIDKSSSMNSAIEIGKQIASMVSAVIADDVPFYVYAFDTIPYAVETKDKSLQGWGEALKYIKANGCTCCGAPLVALKNAKQYVENVIMVSDENENSPPAFLKSYNEYCEAMNVKPAVHMVRCGSFTNQISDKLERAGVELTKYDIRSQSDYYSLPQLITYLTAPSRLELLMQIMAFPLPKRKVAKQHAKKHSKPVLETVSS